MTQETLILGLLAETFVHPGCGQSEGAIDLPVSREAATDFPFIAGSGLKGALRDRARTHWPDTAATDNEERELNSVVSKAFGEQEKAGDLLVGDARLLLLPVRSLTGAYKWVTCPLLLERLNRDLKRSGLKGVTTLDERLEQKGFLGSGKDTLYLEERTFNRKGDLPDGITEGLGQLVLHESTRGRLEEQLVILHDDDFVWFARYGLPVHARNLLDDKSKTSDNLWYEETLPPDTLLYSLLGARRGDSVSDVKELLGEHSYLQVGGNETVGQGWFAARILAEENAS